MSRPHDHGSLLVRLKDGYNYLQANFTYHQSTRRTCQPGILSHFAFGISHLALYLSQRSQRTQRAQKQKSSQNDLICLGEGLSISPDGPIGTPALQGSLSEPSTSTNIFFTEPSEGSSEPAERESGREICVCRRQPMSKIVCVCLCGSVANYLPLRRVRLK